jgi:hypothetical protein
MINFIQEECSSFGNIIFIYSENAADKKSEVGMIIFMNSCYPIWAPCSADVNFAAFAVILWCRCHRLTPQEEVNWGSVRISWGHGMRPFLAFHLTICYTCSMAYTEMQKHE